MSEHQVLVGAEAFYFEGNEIGCLLAHGFTGTPQSMRYLGEFLAREGGLTVACPRLTGHGTTPEDMAASTAEDWVRTVEGALETLRRQCDKIFVGGLSMGGTLALYLAAMYPNVVSGVVPINASVFLNKPDFARLAFMADAPQMIPGCGSDIQDPTEKEVVYSVIPVPAIRQFYALMGATRDLLPRVVCPTLIFQSRQDHVVHPDNAPFILERVCAREKELVWLENSYHVATLDHDKDLIGHRMLDFIRTTGNGSCLNYSGSSR